MFDLRRSTTQLQKKPIETMNTMDEEEMSQQLQQTKPLKVRRHSVAQEQPPLKLSELTHSRQKSLSAQYKTCAPAKSLSRLQLSLASSSLTLREEELNESRSSNTTWRTNTKPQCVQAMKRLHLVNNSG